MLEPYTIEMIVTFESKVEIEVEATDENQAIELAQKAVSVSDAHAEAYHTDTDYWSTISGPEQ